MGIRVRTLPLGRDRWGIYSTKGGYILSSLREERLGEKGGAFFNGKEGRDDFRTPFLKGKEGFCPLEGVEKTIEGRFSKNPPFI